MGASGSPDKLPAIDRQPNSAVSQSSADDWSPSATSTKSLAPRRPQSRPPIHVRAARPAVIAAAAGLSIRVPTDGVFPSSSVAQRAVPVDLARIASSISSTQNPAAHAIEPGADIVVLLVYHASAEEIEADQPDVGDHLDTSTTEMRQYASRSGVVRFVGTA